MAVRVHELAREFGVESKVVLSTLKDMVTTKVRKLMRGSKSHDTFPVTPPAPLEVGAGNTATVYTYGSDLFEDMKMRNELYISAQKRPGDMRSNSPVKA